eukprot:4958079-Pleurochrysis_carterae.AAC.1
MRLTLLRSASVASLCLTTTSLSLLFLATTKTVVSTFLTTTWLTGTGRACIWLSNACVWLSNACGETRCASEAYCSLADALACPCALVHARVRLHQRAGDEVAHAEEAHH